MAESTPPVAESTPPVTESTPPVPESSDSRSKSAFSSLRSSSKAWFKKAKDVSNLALSKGKQSFKLATDEFRNHLTDVYTHAEVSKTGIKTHTSKLTEHERIQRGMRSGKVMAKRTISVARKASLGMKELVEPGFYATMDCDDEAGFGLVYHYSHQFGRFHKNNEEAQKNAKSAADIIHTRLAHTKLVRQKYTSLQAELSALPNTMTTLTTAVETVHELRHSLHGVEEMLLKLEKTTEDLEYFRTTEAQRHLIAEYKLATHASIKQHKKNAQNEYRKARKDASKSAAKLIKERQAVLGDMFQAQMALFKEQGRQDVLVGKVVSPVSLSRQSSIVDPEDQAHMAAFLASNPASRRPSQTDILEEDNKSPDSIAEGEEDDGVGVETQDTSNNPQDTETETEKETGKEPENKETTTEVKKDEVEVDTKAEDDEFVDASNE